MKKRIKDIKETDPHLILWLLYMVALLGLFVWGKLFP